jgi:hypothetical protein
MATRYPPDLPAVPDDRWNAEKIRDGGNPDMGTAWVLVTVDADDAEQAERRVLAHIDHDFEDDLRGAVATDAGPGDRPGQRHVRVNFAAPR